MDGRIRFLAVVLLACFGLLFLQLNNFQVRQAALLQRSPYQPNTTPNIWNQPRGEIVSSDGVVLAASAPVKDALQEQRSYPTGALFADVTGYYDQVDESATGIENEYDQYLQLHTPSANNLSQLLTEHNGTDTVALTISDHLQQVARAALGGEQGAIVAINPQNGAVLALYANPTFDPNLLASHDSTAVHSAYNQLYTAYAKAGNAVASPLINGATQQTYPPGSTFKVVTTSAMYDHDPQLTSQSLPHLSSLVVPDTNKLLHNFGGETCGGDLAQILAFSCDTAFAKIGLELGASSLSSEATAFGLNAVPPIDLPTGEVNSAQFPSTAFLTQNVPFLAYSALGQGTVTETALQNALIAAGIANHGQIMAPHLLATVLSDEGSVITSYQPHVWRNATSQATADSVRQLMLGVTQMPGGTGYGLFPLSDNVAAKTGTAETGTTGCTANWFIATAPAGAGETPTVAVAAVVPYHTGQTCDATGAAVAGPVAKAVLLAALAQK